MKHGANAGAKGWAPKLYLITDRRQTSRPLAEAVALAIAGGADAVQLREKDLGARDMARLGSELLALTKRAGAPLLINDRIDVALACGAEGVHLTGSSLETSMARVLLGPAARIGVSTHSLEEALGAPRDGADFVVFGPIFATPSKRAHGDPQGIERLREVCARTPCPVVAIGGIKAHNVAEALEAGAAGVAVISAIMAASDPQAAAAQLADIVRLHAARLASAR